MTENKAQIEAKNLTIGYGDFVLLQNLNFVINFLYNLMFYIKIFLI